MDLKKVFTVLFAVVLLVFVGFFVYGALWPSGHFNLDFIPVAKERYFLICRDETLQMPEAAQMVEIIRDPTYGST